MEGVRYKYPVRGYQLEALVEDLFKFYGCDTKRTAYTQDSNYDIYAEKNGKKFFIEVSDFTRKILRHKIKGKMNDELVLDVYERALAK